MSDREDRAMGPEMTAEQWWVIGGDSIMWVHEPSARCVVVSGPVPRKSGNYSCMGIVALPDEPTDPATEGYLVKCTRCDESGEPYEGTAFWIESYGEAIKRARAVRASILTEHPPIMPREQMSLDEALSAPSDRKGGTDG